MTSAKQTAKVGGTTGGARLGVGVQHAGTRGGRSPHSAIMSSFFGTESYVGVDRQRLVEPRCARRGLPRIIDLCQRMWSSSRSSSHSMPGRSGRKRRTSPRPRSTCPNNGALRVGGDVTAIEPGHYRPPTNRFKCERLRHTLCQHRACLASWRTVAAQRSLRFSAPMHPRV
jgi:hypothetical protein